MTVGDLVWLKRWEEDNLDAVEPDHDDTSHKVECDLVWLQRLGGRRPGRFGARPRRQPTQGSSSQPTLQDGAPSIVLSSSLASHDSLFMK
jgi:hypothetical protein